MKKNLSLTVACVLALTASNAYAQYYKQGQPVKPTYQVQRYRAPQMYGQQVPYHQQTAYNQQTAPSNYYLRPYLGVSYIYSIADFDDDITLFGDENYKIFSNQMQSFAFAAGLKFHPNFAVELSYQKSNKAKGSSNYHYTGIGVTDDANFKTQADLQTFAIDLVANTESYGNLTFLGSVGAGYYTLKYSGVYSLTATSGSGTYYGSDSASETEHKFGFRAGIGAEYAMTENLSFRALARLNFIDTKGSDIIDEYTNTKMDDWGKLSHTVDLNFGIFYYLN